ncbi:hypothetical protein CTAYLR_004672 [Chrysophaeum taylorii]|uniref:Methyltransferase domain-containing protein n=1 Tax=Chrysophaeum taylorii TaxID=2483200 RepID=A0AAD7XFQ1_9STRA|nr:hypothetical protein CTAYLR_004672 [Chrysophaeum taylorii]
MRRRCLLASGTATAVCLLVVVVVVVLGAAAPTSERPLPQEAEGPPPEALRQRIAAHLAKFAATTNTSSSSSRVSAERARVERHAGLFHEFLPEDAGSARPRRVGDRYRGAWSVLDYWEPELSCVDERRIPKDVFGDGPKWLCAPQLLRGAVVSLGSNFDDSFETGVAALTTGGEIYVVDPTLQDFGAARVDSFRKKLQAYGATLNETVGVGEGTLVSARTGRAYPLVPLGRIIEDLRLSRVAILKMDVEGAEYAAMRDVAAMCDARTLAIDQLAVEVHLVSGVTVADVYDLFANARRCHLLLHHKERNAWGCGGNACVEFSWVSVRHARRARLAMMVDNNDHTTTRTTTSYGRREES